MSRFSKHSCFVTLSGSIALVITIAVVGVASADPYIRDDVNDTGVEPNPSSSVMYLSPDIGVSNGPLQGWTPYPYPSASPPAWAVTLPSDDPDYRSPLSGQPNYIYVRVRNNGATTSGTEHLFVYWASASTGLSWDPAKAGGSFIDNVQSNVLFGQEITKPRKNAATATQAERDAYIAAIRKVATDATFVFNNGGESYWRTQQAIHRFGPINRHHTVAFLPWHREFVNRYEGLLQEADPKIKLLYWQWTDDPRMGPLNFFTSSFMGASGYGQSSGVPIGLPLSPDTDGAYSNFYHSAIVVERRLQSGSPPAESDATVLGRTGFDDTVLPSNNFSNLLERNSHDHSHPYIGGSWAGNTDAGDMSVPNTATRDPFFFLLHTKVDELWARWQRQSLVNFDPNLAFDSATNDANITDPSGMEPWNGAAEMDSYPNTSNGTVPPWIPGDIQTYTKLANDRSVISPPIYDTALLTIPVLLPGEEVIMEIPWYPPNPASFGNINDPGHVCLIARIETSSASPFGMTFSETSDINYNTRQNNKVAWRNVHVVDTFPGPFKMIHFLVGDTTPRPVTAGLLFGAVLNAEGANFAKAGTVRIDLGPELFKRWRKATADARGMEVLSDGVLRMSAARAELKGIPLRPGETFPVRLTFELNRDYQPTKKGAPIAFDVVQTGMPGKPDAVVGGNRYNIDLEKLTFVPQGETWRWLPGFKPAPQAWTSPDFNDTAWYQRRLELGLENILGAGHDTPVTTYFRHAFDIDDPGFVRTLIMRIRRADGAVVYLNGKEIYRANMPDGRVDASTSARNALTAIERMAYFPIKLDRALLRRGRNVIAVEVHKARKGPVDPAFDLELDANWETPLEAPYVAFTNIPAALLAHVGRPVSIEVGALSTMGEIRQATLSVDGKVEQTLDRPPFRFNWTARSGPHRLTATVSDSNGQQSNAYSTVTGVKNLPPTVEIVQPSAHIEMVRGGTLTVTARANDPDGKIAGVDFYVDDRFLFTDPERFVGSDTTAPYSVTLRDLKVGDNMIMAIARDNDGAKTTAIPIMVIVRADRGRSP